MQVSTAETPDIPANLLTAVTADHPRLSTVRLFAKRPNAVAFDISVCIVTLHADDDGPVRVGHPPKDAATDIVAAIMKAARTYATENGETKFQAQLSKCAPERGPTAKPQLVAFDTATSIAPETNSEADLHWRIAEGLWKEHRALLTAATALATAQVSMIQSLGSAFASIIDRERANAASTADAEIARLAASIERDRIAMLNKSLSPVLVALQRKLGVGPGAAPTSAGEKVEQLARQARSLATSLTGPQWDVAKSKLSARASDALDRMRNVTTDADTMQAVADLVAEPVELLLEVYAALDGSQQSGFEALQNAVSDAAEKSKTDEGTPGASGA